MYAMVASVEDGCEFYPPTSWVGSQIFFNFSMCWVHYTKKKSKNAAYNSENGLRPSVMQISKSSIEELAVVSDTWSALQYTLLLILHNSAWPKSTLPRHNAHVLYTAGKVYNICYFCKKQLLH